MLPRILNPDKLAKIQDYCRPDIQIRQVEFDPGSGSLDQPMLSNTVTDRTAAVYFENPSYFGLLETGGPEISEIAHRLGAMCVVSVDPLSLGVLSPPASYGADIVTGDIQPLGIPMQFGGGHAGFIASPDEERFVQQYPTRLWGIAPTRSPGEYGFGDVAFERTSFAQREKGKEWVGTTSAMWGIVAAVYLSLMGPEGMREIAEGIMTRTRYAMQTLARIDGVQVPFINQPHFQEFIMRYEGSGKTVQDLNRSLLAQGIFGGKDVSGEFPDLGQCCLICISEVHAQADIDALASKVEEGVA